VVRPSHRQRSAKSSTPCAFCPQQRREGNHASIRNIAALDPFRLLVALHLVKQVASQRGTRATFLRHSLTTGSFETKDAVLPGDITGDRNTPLPGVDSRGSTFGHGYTATSVGHVLNGLLGGGGIVVQGSLRGTPIAVHGARGRAVASVEAAVLSEEFVVGRICLVARSARQGVRHSEGAGHCARGRGFATEDRDLTGPRDSVEGSLGSRWCGGVDFGVVVRSLQVDSWTRDRPTQSDGVVQRETRQLRKSYVWSLSGYRCMAVNVHARLETPWPDRIPESEVWRSEQDYRVQRVLGTLQDQAVLELRLVSEGVGTRVERTRELRGTGLDDQGGRPAGWDLEAE
jgi:hypothetical protein